MYRYSLRKRVAIAFAVCVAMLSVVWGFAFFTAIKLSEDRVLTRQLEHAVEGYPIMPANIVVYENVDNLPESLKLWAQARPKVGVYEFESAELHVAVIQPVNSSHNVFVVFDVEGIEAESSEDWLWLLGITIVVGTLGTLGFGLGVIVMRRAVAPVTQLAKTVSKINPEQLTDEDHKRIEAKNFGDDEVGVLARTLEQTLERVGAFVERERYFTAAASHELRTPITVITGAIELLELIELSDEDKKILDRLRRANLDMKTTIEMFLCLARETDEGLYNELFFVMPLVNKAVEQQRHLLNRKSIELDIEKLANPKIYGHPPAFFITVNNLIRNAFEHTLLEQAKISILVKENELLITNQLTIKNNESNMFIEPALAQGYGLGLGIVQRLCERNEWSFSLNLEDGSMVAQLSW
ncbi:sensor histidine kinase [Aliiglaciecola lipolytica]|nr:HAMP domain-containing sensor histidine kinase [Aliiglaciecola lipolytica]